MILTCPTCGTRYKTDRSRLAPPGGNVRCAKCLAVWFQNVSEAEESLEPDSGEALLHESRSETREEIPGAAQVVRGNNRALLALVVGWGALLLFVGAFVWAAIALRHEIATVWPQSSAFYAAINLPVNVRGLALTDIEFDRVVENGENVLRISGRISNVSEAELPVPGIGISLRDEDARQVYAWTINAGIARLGPGQSRPFLTRLPDPPPEMRSVDVDFVSD
nr:MAG: hypothetical protein E4H34_00815 [Hyphomicrobiales bacterium]